MEFWVIACLKYLSGLEEVRTVSVIDIVILLAAFIGPLSTIRLIPRLAYRPIGSTDIWLNTMFQNLWPDRSVLAYLSNNITILVLLTAN